MVLPGFSSFYLISYHHIHTTNLVNVRLLTTCAQFSGTLESRHDTRRTSLSPPTIDLFRVKTSKDQQAEDHERSEEQQKLRQKRLLLLLRAHAVDQ